MTLYRLLRRLHAPLAAGAVCLAIAGMADAQQRSMLLSDEWAPRSLCSRERLPFRFQHRAFTSAGGAGGQRDGRHVIGGLAFRASRDDPDSPLPNAYSDGYSLRFPLLDSMSSVPLFGRLYRVSGIGTKDKGGADFRPVNSVLRVPEERTPEDVLRTVNSYVIPLDDRPEKFGTLHNHCGTLHNHFIYVQGTEKVDPGGTALRVHVGLLPITEDRLARREEDIVWTWLAEGDAFDIGGHKHRLLRIVPPQLFDDGILKRVGWFELDPKPLGAKDPPPSPAEAPGP